MLNCRLGREPSESILKAMALALPVEVDKTLLACSASSLARRWQRSQGRRLRDATHNGNLQGNWHAQLNSGVFVKHVMMARVAPVLVCCMCDSMRLLRLCAFGRRQQSIARGSQKPRCRRGGGGGFRRGWRRGGAGGPPLGAEERGSWGKAGKFQWKVTGRGARRRDAWESVGHASACMGDVRHSAAAHAPGLRGTCPCEITQRLTLMSGAAEMHPPFAQQFTSGALGRILYVLALGRKPIVLQEVVLPAIWPTS